MLSAFMCSHFGYFNHAGRLCSDLESLLLFPQILVYKADTQVRDHKDERRSTSVLNQSVTLPTECFLHPVETDNTHPAMAPVCVWYMKAFVTLGGVLSVCFTVTLHERCSESVAIGASLLLSSAPPRIRYASVALPCFFSHSVRFPTFITPVFFPHSINPLFSFSPLPLLSSKQPVIFLSDPPSAFPSPSFFPLSPFRFLPPTHKQPH